MNLLPFVSMHLQETSDPFSFPLCRIEDRVSRFQRSRVDSKESELPCIRIVHNFEGQSRKGMAIVGGDGLFKAFQVDPFYRREIERRREVVNDGIEQGLN